MLPTCQLSAVLPGGTNWQATAIAYGNNTLVAVGTTNFVLQSDTYTPGSLSLAPILSMSQAPTLIIAGIVGRDYQVEYADAIGGTNSFQPLAVIHLPTSPYTWADTTATNKPKRFYRVALLP